MELTHYDVLKAEKFGSRPELGKILTYCKRCREQINTLYNEHCQDKYGNIFCCELCAVDYHGIKLMEV